MGSKGHSNLILCRGGKRNLFSFHLLGSQLGLYNKKQINKIETNRNLLACLSHLCMRQTQGWVTQRGDENVGLSSISNKEQYVRR